MIEENNNSSKKKSLILVIIAIILVVAIIGSTVAFLALKNNNNGGTTNNGDVPNKSKDGIKQIEVYYTLNVVALSNNGDLYVIGENESGWGNVKETDKVTKVASNVNSFEDDGMLYIDNDSNLYITGLNVIKGGTYKVYEKLGENIKNVSSGGLSVVAVSNNGKLYGYGQKDYNGLNKQCSELTEFDNVSDVKTVYKGISIIYYITNSGELYAKYDSSDTFDKLLDNVAETNGGSIFKTTDGKYYLLECEESKCNVTEKSNVKGYVLDYFINNNGEIINKQDSKYIVEDLSLYYPKDVKEMIDMGGYGLSGLIYYIYLNNNNKLTLYTVNYKQGNYTVKLNESSKELDYTIDSLNEIYKLLRKVDDCRMGKCNETE